MLWCTGGLVSRALVGGDLSTTLVLWCTGALVGRAPSSSQPSWRAMFTASPLSSLKPNLALSLAITLLELAASSWPAPVIPPWQVPLQLRAEAGPAPTVWALELWWAPMGFGDPW